MPTKGIEIGNAYSPEQICAIIKQAQECGVTRLKIGDLVVSFLPPEPKTRAVATLTKEQLREAEADQNKVFLENERRLRLEELSELRLSDPEAYEDLQSRGELTPNAREESYGIEG